eukprot:Lithocolla_globosa_v1_NODE_7766_length_903_cov_3.227594.p2 type:complete len:162 gc:universal NODE_7766_length_903_cov_3.227594:642-157(-)
MLGEMEVKTQAKSNEDTRNDDISQAQHGELQLFSHQILWEQQFDWSIKRLCHGNHHFGSKHPENVVNKQPREEGNAGFETVKMHQFNGPVGERLSENIVCNPMFGVDIISRKESSEHNRGNVNTIKRHIDKLYCFSCQLEFEARATCKNTERVENGVDQVS